MGIIESANLFYREGNSDKVYNLQLILIEEDNRYRVDFQYGRRGSSLNVGSKIEGASIIDARKVYNKVYGEKIGKGYQIASQTQAVASASSSNIPESQTGQPKKKLIPFTVEPVHRRILWTPADAGAQKATTPVLIVPQLLNMIDESEVEKYLRDDGWGLQEKKDGRHQMIQTNPIMATNKKGKEIPAPEFASAFGGFMGSRSIFDGEAIGNVYHVFDALELEGKDLRSLGYGERWNRLDKVSHRFPEVRLVRLVTGYEAKKAMYDYMKAEKKEGVVFKKLDAPFKPGRPSSGGDMLKFKFVAEASVRVREGRTGKRSVGLEILDGDRWVDVGNVTIPPNKEIPKVGQIIEIRYLYVQGRGGHLYQPFFKEVRTDIDASECTVKQLKYKCEED